MNYSKDFTFQVKPSNIKWWIGETERRDFDTFNWRFFTRDNAKFRLVTLE